ncbi:MAG TPA: PKD domain-containing protein [Gammaproteobacteria bacterium]|nr:PKD domain-containing protein [Gammaproteobacteria bacterium]
MSRLIQNWRNLSLMLLVALLASAICTPALAQTQYDSLCASCHGLPPGTGRFPLNPDNFATTAELASFIDAQMPPTDPSMCSTACAQAIAEFLKPTNRPPVANASNSSPLTGKAPLIVNFNGSASTDDKGIVSYAWSFGDGTTGNGVTTAHTYAIVGTYNASLKVTDAEGLQNSTPVTVTVATSHKAPVANASRSTNLTGIAPLTSHFDASLSTCDGGCIYYGWTFDGNITVDGMIIDHTFTTVGAHSVKLTVVDAGGFLAPDSASSITFTVNVSASSNPPVANASKSPNLKGAIPFTAQFDASLSTCANTCGSYTWNFGDGSTTTLVDPTATHTYTAVGAYTVTLTVTDAGNGKKSSTTVQVKTVPAESLVSYVSACQSQLGFQNISIPNIDCYDGDLFATSADFNKNGSVNDYMGYRKITDQVDLAFACRWLFGSKDDRRNPISVEMLLHNRQSGNTCFFSAKGFVSGDTNPVSSIITSPTSSAASSFWDSPAGVDGHIRCVGCHVSGPYIATPTIAPFLAKYGLLNNGHDTLHNVTTTNLTAPVKYHAISGTVNGVPGAFSLWDGLKQSYLDPVESTCSQGCHMVGTRSPQGDVGQIQRGFTTILTNPANELLEINHANAMPPDSDGSDYRWINLDTPGDGAETESFAAAKSASTTLVPKLLNNCAAPGLIEAHAVGSNYTFIATPTSNFALLPDKLSAFNLKDGLVCLHSDQESGRQCQDYMVRYECTAPNGNKTWTDWYNTDSPNFDGDHEGRNRAANLCLSPAGSTVTAIEAGVTLNNGWTYTAYGPNDRLARFSPYGLTCNNPDQPDGLCSNYVVRYSNCGAVPTASTARLTNAWSNMQLTATATPNNSETRAQPANSGWTSQNWTIEPVPNTGYVRLKNVWAGRYLNVQSNAENASILIYDLVADWTSEQWLIEPVSGSSDVRLRNVWTGRYLTITDTSNFSAVRAQTLNRTWASQRWRIQY